MKLVAQTARRTNVLYVAPEGREARLARGAFDKSHPHLTLEFTNDVNDARRHLKENGGIDALLVGWSVGETDALALIAHVRQQSLPIAVIAAGEDALERYAQAGADECVARGASFLARLPDAIDGAVAKLQAAAARPDDAAQAPRPLRVAYVGDVQFLKGSLGADRTLLHITPLAQAVAEADAGRGGVDVVLLDHSARDADTGAALAEVKRVGWAVPVALLVDPPDETAALRNFDGVVDECLVKTPGWTARLARRLSTVRARVEQARELEALRGKEARLRALVDRLPACVVRLSADGAVLAMNLVALELVGATEPRQILRKPFQALVNPLDIDTCTGFVHRVAGGEQRSIELSLTTLTGTGRVVEATAVPVAPEEGRPGSVLMVLRDVTERKRLETALEQTRRPETPSPEPAAAPAPSSAFIVEHSQAIALTVTDPAVTPAAVAAPPEPPVSGPGVAPAAAPPAVDPGQLRDMEAALTRLCGQARVTFQELEDALREAEAQHDAALARQHEIHAQLEAAHRERWQSYEAFVSGAQLGIFQVDAQGAVVEANPAFARALGYDSPSDLLTAGAPFTDPVAWAGAVESWSAATAPVAFETRWKRKDGALAVLRLTGQLRHQPEPGDARIEIVAENLTALRALEAQVRRARKWEDVARSTTGIAADLRGLVDGMSESARQVLQDTALDATTRQQAAALEAAVARAAELSRQLVAFGRRGVRAPEPLDVNAVVRAVEDLMRRLVDDHIELSLDLAPSLELVEGERAVLEEALVNLAVAAGDALPAGGCVRIATASVDVSTSTSAGPPAGEYVALSLITQGWGAATRGPESSAGVTAAQRAIERLSGVLTVEAVSDESLAFCVYLPQASVAILTDDSHSTAGDVAVRG